jgi:predicted nuclease of predicted toxin-antitoxin system
MNFLANENFPLFSIRFLRTAGYNVASVIEDTPGAKDHDVLKRAQKEVRILLTFDRIMESCYIVINHLVQQAWYISVLIHPRQKDLLKFYWTSLKKVK